MKRSAVVGLFLALVIGVMSGLVSPAQADTPTRPTTVTHTFTARVSCGNGHREGQDGRFGFPNHSVEWRVASIHKPCLKTRKNKSPLTVIRPKTLRYTYIEHAEISSCEVPFALDYVSFIAYYSDSRGRNYRVGEYRLDCQLDGFNTHVEIVGGDVGYLKSTIEHPAKLRVEMKAVVRNPGPDSDDTGYFRLHWFRFPFDRLGLPVP